MVTKKNPRESVEPEAGAPHYKRPLLIDLALQGGGSHGAFTWGVLDRLLEDEDIEIRSISGTSAGALNGAMLLEGWAQGGAIGARKKLREFWEAIAQSSAVFAPVSDAFQAMGWGTDNRFATNFMDMMSRVWSPYQLNPLNLNPLRDILEKLLDLKALHACPEKQLFVTATNVETGQPRVFTREEVTIDSLLASACLPFVFQAVEIDGVPYWDGGYVGNPAIWPLIYNADANDVLLVQINPLNRPGTPSSASDIIARLNEITFNASLISELRAIEFVQRLVKEQRVDKDHYRDLRLHRIAMNHEANDLDASSKSNTNSTFLHDLHGQGRHTATQWLANHKADIGKRATVDIKEDFLLPPSKKPKKIK